MRSQGKRNPDHFQVHPDPVPNQQAVVRQTQRALHREEARGLRSAEAAREHVIHAGEPLEHPHDVRCTHCDMETALPAGQVVIPCRNCGATTYRLVV